MAHPRLESLGRVPDIRSLQGRSCRLEHVMPVVVLAKLAGGLPWGIAAALGRTGPGGEEAAWREWIASGAADGAGVPGVVPGRPGVG